MRHSNWKVVSFSKFTNKFRSLLNHPIVRCAITVPIFSKLHNFGMDLSYCFLFYNRIFTSVISKIFCSRIEIITNITFLIEFFLLSINSRINVTFLQTSSPRSFLFRQLLLSSTHSFLQPRWKETFPKRWNLNFNQKQSSTSIFLLPHRPLRDPFSTVSFWYRSPAQGEASAKNAREKRRDKQKPPTVLQLRNPWDQLHLLAGTITRRNREAWAI